MNDCLLTAGEVAELLSVPESWVRQHTRSGAIPHLVLGRYRRYRRDDVLSWLETLTTGNGPQFRRYAPRTPNRAGDADTPRPSARKE